MRAAVLSSAGIDNDFAQLAICEARLPSAQHFGKEVQVSHAGL